MKILITGGTGMVGTALTKALVATGHSVIILTRNPASGKPMPGVIYKAWNPANQTIDAAAIREADAIVHLAGANVADGRWTEARKKEILDSRVQSGQLLVKALSDTPNAIRTVVSASAIGWYGADPQVPNPVPFVETEPADVSFLGVTCQQWEAAIAPVVELGKRLVTYRIGIVLSKEGGAYAEFRKPLRLGVASVLGSGNQVISWIHIDDLVSLFMEALADESFRGIYNAVADVPVSNKVLIKAMAQAKGGFHVTAPVPAFVLKAMLGEMSIEILKSATVSNSKVREAGFAFAFPTIEKAVRELEAGES